MIKFTGRLYQMNFDATGYKKALDDAAKVQIRQAARAWLRAVIPLVPVWTGMARGSLKPLGRFLRVAVPIVASPTAKPTPRHNQAAGERQQEFTFGNSNGVYTFQFDTHVLHYYLNEYFDMKSVLPGLIQDTPWRSFVAGRQAFDDYMFNVAVTRMPSYGEFIHSKLITPRQ